MKKLYGGICVLILISCSKVVKKVSAEEVSIDQNAVTACYGTWYQLNEEGKVIVLDFGNNEQEYLHSIRVTKDSICDNWQMEKSCWENKITLSINDDTIKISTEFYFILSDSVKKSRTILTNLFSSGIKYNERIEEYIELSLLDSYPKEIIKYEDDDIDIDSTQNEESDDFLENLKQFAKENPSSN